MRMKDIIRYFLVAFVTFGMVSCSWFEDDDPGFEDIAFDLSQVTVLSHGQFNAREYIEGKIAEVQQSNDLDQDLADAYLGFYKNKLEEIEEKEEAIRNQAGGALNDVNTILGYEYVALVYPSVSVNGDLIPCSELLVWPWGVLWNPRPDDVIIGCHCTITDDKSRPSNYASLGFTNDVAMLALMNTTRSQYSLVIIPDYEGYGESRDNSHPYCNRDVTARQVIDGVRAGISYYERNQKKLEPKWRSVAVGYSQGGAVAAGVYRYAREHALNDLRLVGAVCGDGPYDPIATLKRYISDGKLYMPVAAALILKGAVDTDPEMKRLKCKYSDFCTNEFLQSWVFYDLEDKEKSTTDIHRSILDYSASLPGDFPFHMYCWDNKSQTFQPYAEETARSKAYDFDLSAGKAKSYLPIECCFHQGVIDFFPGKEEITEGVNIDKLNALKRCLERNSLVYQGWKPPKNSGLTFFHSTRDEVVPIDNMDAVDREWYFGYNDCYRFYRYKTDTYLHVGTGRAFYLAYATDFVNKIFKNEWEPGRTTIDGGKW